MDEAFDSFNAPQFVDFSQGVNDEENAEAYFEMDHENVNHEVVAETDSFYSPMMNTPGFPLVIEYSERQSDPLEDSYEAIMGNQNIRRSLSVGNLPLSLPLSKNENNGHCRKAESNSLMNPSKTKSGKSVKNVPSHSSLGSMAGPNKCLAPKLSRTRMSSMSRDHLNKLAQPKRHRQYVSADTLDKDNDFVSLAEYCKNYQNQTPPRFRSRPKLQPPSPLCFKKQTNTVPQSPALLTKKRARPVHLPNQEEREKIEFDKEQRFKIKAYPLNKKVLHGPIKPTVLIEKKSNTIPEPFKLTAPAKKVVQSPVKANHQFHARPVPKMVYEAPKIKETEKKVTEAHTPTFMRRYNSRDNLLKVEKDKSNKENRNEEKNVPLTRTEVKPFSFEERNKRLQKKKEAFIEAVLEEEKKKREFHAKPIPKSLLKSMKNCSLKKSLSGESLESTKQHKTSSAENICTQFKARPPTVLNKEPFVPKRGEHPLTVISEFQLNTEVRAKEREAYEQEKREKEVQLNYLRQMEEEARLREEAEEIARLRKMTEYKAKPVKKYKEVIIEPANKVTQPISPKFCSRKKDNST